MLNSPVELILAILGSLLSALGMLALGFGLAWFALDIFKKQAENWYLLLALVLGLFGLAIAMAAFLTPASLGAFSLGLGGGLLLFGLLAGRAKKEKKEGKDED